MVIDPKAMRLVWRAVILVWRSAPIWMAANAFVVLMTALLPLLFLLVLKSLIDSAAAMIESGGDEATLNDLLWWIAAACGIGLIQALNDALGLLAKDAQAQATTDRAADILHEKSIAADLEYYENPDYRDSLHRAQREAGHRPRAIVAGLLGVASNAVGLAAMIGVLFTFHWAAVPILFLASLPGGFLRLRYAREIYGWKRDRTTVERLVGYFSSLITETRFAKEVRLFGLGPYLRRRSRDARDLLRQEKLQISVRKSAAEFAGDACAVIGMFTVLFLIAHQAFIGAITIGGLAMYFHALNRARGQLGNLLMNISQLYEHYLFLVDFFGFVDLKPKLLDPVEPRPVPRPMKTGIVFDHVSFRYPSRGDTVLKDICMEIAPGEHVALVGLNGAGKTTLTKLLARLYDPTEGSISIDGTDLRSFRGQDLRREISVILQDYGKYQLTARQNIWFGDVELDDQDPRIAEAARQAGADETIGTFEKGYDTNLGTMLQGARELSEGQWQRVALSRAILRDAQILILDEPTASMDPRAEQEIFKRFHQLASGRTTILISHRLFSVTIVDRIFVIDHGRIVEQGSHEELLRQRGLYANLFEMQSRQYEKTSDRDQ